MSSFSSARVTAGFFALVAALAMLLSAYSSQIASCRLSIIFRSPCSAMPSDIAIGDATVSPILFQCFFLSFCIFVVIVNA